MSEGVIVALIAATQAIVLAIGVPLIAKRLGTIRRDASATRDQVVNDHKTNLREENDGRHAETLALFREVRKDIGGLRSDVRAIGGRVTELEHLEITNPRHRKEPS